MKNPYDQSDTSVVQDISEGSGCTTNGHIGITYQPQLPVGAYSAATSITVVACIPDDNGNVSASPAQTVNGF
jgi:hypothetical protein